MNTLGRQTRKILVGIVGGLVTLIGLILVPYPGPGWLIVFAGLTILSTEFEFASKVLHFAKDKYDQWIAWLKRQIFFVRWTVLALTGVVIVCTLWVFNAFGLINTFLNLNMDWLISPLAR